MAVQCSISRAAARMPFSGEPCAELPSRLAPASTSPDSGTCSTPVSASIPSKPDGAMSRTSCPAALSPSASPTYGWTPPRLSMEAIAMRMQ